MNERKEIFSRARRLVVKVGTSVLTTKNNRLDTSYLEELVEEIAEIKRQQKEVVLVTSGAIAAGLKSLGLTHRPGDLPTLQAAAAVGQSHLMRTYERLFKERGLVVGQVLLTQDIVREPERYQNARDTLQRLIALGVVPIVNENDAVATEEIRFGDNDTLSALVLKLINADILIILSDVNGFYLEGKVCPQINALNPAVIQAAGGSHSEKSVGGMATKIEAARIVTGAGRPLVVANGRIERVLHRLLAGEELGTAFLPKRKVEKR